MITNNLLRRSLRTALPVVVAWLAALSGCCSNPGVEALKAGFDNPPLAAKPGVYWYFMDGNLSEEAITKDLESMKEAGIGHVVYLEVNVGVPRGPVPFLSDRWKDLFKHAVEQAERLGIAITLGVGPGWTGSGGPWVKPEQSMRHLVSSSVQVDGGGRISVQLPVPAAKRPYFGSEGFTPEMKEKWQEYYADVAVLAFKTPAGNKIEDADEKALFYRPPYSSAAGLPRGSVVRQYIPSLPLFTAKPGDAPVMASDVINLTSSMSPEGVLNWDAPEGKWTLMRLGCRNNGAVTRPAPLPGVGMECDKFDTTALVAHFDVFTTALLQHIGPRDTSLEGGLKMLHMDSWEMGAQNWSDHFVNEFTKRRGYDPLHFLPVYDGVIIQSREMSERFLWDVRQTAQELIIENHAGYIRDYAHKRGMGLSIEPYDMNPTADLELGSVADVPMCEFWGVGYGYNTAFSAAEGTSIAHLKGAAEVPAESFTSDRDGWRQHPGTIKDQTDWAFASGINRLVFHTFAHQSLPEELRPGMTMGRYGVHWDRNQTWWHLAGAYHSYVSRSQFLLQQGRTVADVLYLAPEGSPHVFLAPESAYDTKVFEVNDLNDKTFTLPDRRGYNFDGCPPGLLYQASVEQGEVVFPSGARYKLLVLPAWETMTPQLLGKLAELIEAGATVVGMPPAKSPGLEDYPECDKQVENLVQKLWGGNVCPAELTTRNVGKGRIVWGAELVSQVDNLYPNYRITSSLLLEGGTIEDFAASTASAIRYTHRTAKDYDIYFVANKTPDAVETECSFRVTGRRPELWSAVSGEMRALPEYRTSSAATLIPLRFEPFESYFIVFPKGSTLKAESKKNFRALKPYGEIAAEWSVEFDPKWGGPERVAFDTLTDWTLNADQGIKYYSGSAFYNCSFEAEKDNLPSYIDLGVVKNMARVWLNGQDCGIVWTSPWRADISGAVKTGQNQLRVEVVNLWPNRLIGDEQLPDDGIKEGKWPEWLLKGEPRTSGRYTFAAFRHYKKDSPLLPSGLLGPVTLLGE